MADRARQCFQICRLVVDQCAGLSNFHRLRWPGPMQPHTSSGVQRQAGTAPNWGPTGSISQHPRLSKLEFSRSRVSRRAHSLA
jgi:hypothetical protein